MQQCLIKIVECRCSCMSSLFYVFFLPFYPGLILQLEIAFILSTELAATSIVRLAIKLKAF